MGKNALSVIVLSGILILGLLVWNVYLVNQVSVLQKSQKELEFRFQILEGDNAVLSYDLVTSRDSLRILKKRISSQ